MNPMPASWNRGIYAALLLVLLAAIALAYWPGMGGGFAFDDYANIVLNQRLHVKTLSLEPWLAATFSSPAADLPRPLAMFSFAINHYFTQLDPRPMKIGNLLVHLGNALLLSLLLQRLLRTAVPQLSESRRNAAALFGAACWALMPINLMPVLLVVQRMESLANLFVLAGLLCYLQARTRRRGVLLPMALLAVFTFVGALAKESAVLLPLYAFLLECFVLRFRAPDGERQRGLLPGFTLVLFLPALVAVAWLLPKALAPDAYATRDFGMAERLMTEPGVLMDYLRWTLAPNLRELGLFHDDYPVTRSLVATPWPLLSIAGLVAIAGGAAWLRQRRPLSGMGLAWFLAAHLLTATFIPLELVFEHRNYFASAGLCLVLLDLLLLVPTTPSARRLGQAAAIVLLLIYGGLTHERALDWTDPYTFAKNEAERHPNSPRATYSLGQVLSLASDGKADSPATRAAFAAFERAMKIPSSGIAPAQGALLLASRTGEPLREEWWRDMQSRLRRQRIGPQDLASLATLTNCAIARHCHFPDDEMLVTFGAALSRGEHAEVMSVYGNYAYNVLRDPELAERLWRESVRLDPRQAEYHITLVKMLIAEGRFDEAEVQTRTLVSLGRMGQYDEVAKELRERAANAKRARAAAPVNSRS